MVFFLMQTVENLWKYKFVFVKYMLPFALISYLSKVPSSYLFETLCLIYISSTILYQCSVTAIGGVL